MHSRWICRGWTETEKFYEEGDRTYKYLSKYVKRDGSIPEDMKDKIRLVAKAGYGKLDKENDFLQAFINDQEATLINKLGFGDQVTCPFLLMLISHTHPSP